jgi:hypothetical protein
MNRKTPLVRPGSPRDKAAIALPDPGGQRGYAPPPRQPRQPPTGSKQPERK